MPVSTLATPVGDPLVTQVCVSRATRVLVRYLTAEARVSPKAALDIFRRYAPKIEANRDGDPTMAAQLYLEMAGQIHPLSEALEGVVIQRKDEQRKLDHLRVLLRRLGRATEPNTLKSWDSEDELASWIKIRLEGLEEILRSLVRIGVRLSEYTESIQRTYSYGPYTVVNHHGFRAEEVEQALKNLDDATTLVQASGFRSAIYGEITLESPKGVSYAGKYEATPDTIQLNVAARNRFDAVYTLVHEIGHRVWFKLLTDAQRDAYEDQYFGTANRAISVPERETMWHAFQRAEFNPRRVKALLPTELRDVWGAYWKERSKVTRWPKPAELANPGPNVMTLETVHRNFVMPKTRYVVLDESVRSVTDYGKTNVREDFAEVFAHYCSGKPLTDDAELRFSAATGRHV
jgi:hypothetical protein